MRSSPTLARTLLSCLLILAASTAAAGPAQDAAQARTAADVMAGDLAASGDGQRLLAAARMSVRVPGT